MIILIIIIINKTNITKEITNKFLDEVEQNVVICEWRVDDLRDTDKSRYFAITQFNNNCLITWSPSLFFN